MAFRTVGDVVGQVRVLLQDTDAGFYRYDDASLIQTLNTAMLLVRSLRPDIFRTRLNNVPQYGVGDMANGLAFEPMYIPALVNYMVGLAQLRDAEENVDARAAALMGMFTASLGGPSPGGAR